MKSKKTTKTTQRAKQQKRATSSVTSQGENVRPVVEHAPENPLAFVETPAVDSSQIKRDGAMTLPSADNIVQKVSKTMDIVLTRNANKQTKSGKQSYSAPGLRFSLRFPKTAFANGNVPNTVTLSGEGFAEPRVPRAKMTAEERKAARAAAPKLTLAEKIAKREASLAKLKEKANKAAQPSA